MYNLNPLMRNVLITVEEVIFHAPTKHTLDTRTVSQSIIIAEERFIRPAIGTDMYDAMIAAKNVVIDGTNASTYQPFFTPRNITLVNGQVVNSYLMMSQAYQDLWKMYLWKLAAECVMLVSTPEAFVQFSSEGVVHNQPPASVMNTAGVVTPELRSVKFMMDKKLHDRIDPLMESMHTWICKRIGTYPLYGKPCDCDVNGVAYKRKSDWVMGLYNDEKGGGCGCD